VVVQSGNPGGRPKGSKTFDLISMLKEKGLRDHQDEQHYVDEFLDYLIDNYNEDARLMQWMGDHLFGIPPRLCTSKVEPVPEILTGR
jgi:hypothetical protein